MLRIGKGDFVRVDSGKNQVKLTLRPELDEPNRFPGRRCWWLVVVQPRTRPRPVRSTQTPRVGRFARSFRRAARLLLVRAARGYDSLPSCTAAANTHTHTPQIANITSESLPLILLLSLLPNAISANYYCSINNIVITRMITIHAVTRRSDQRLTRRPSVSWVFIVSFSWSRVWFPRRILYMCMVLFWRTDVQEYDLSLPFNRSHGCGSRLLDRQTDEICTRL